MQTAQSLPLSVGVAPGTTTFTLAGPVGEVVPCESAERARYERMRLFPPQKGALAPFTPSPPAAPSAGRPPRRSPDSRVSTNVRAAAARVKRVLDPYGTFETMKGTLGRVQRRRNLGIVLAPYGDTSPNMSYEIVASTKDFATECASAPGRGPNYRWNETSAYETDTGELGAIPTDFQLSTVYGYTPVKSQWARFKQGTWSPLPWIPPQGQPAAYMPRYMTPPLAGPQTLRQGDGTVPAATDPAQAVTDVLVQHNERMFRVGLISAAAVASTALINVFRYSAERRDARRKTRVAAEPSPTISGHRRRRHR